MSATDELRRMLDERGVVWGNVRNDGSESEYLTEWQFDGNQGGAVAIEWAVGSGLSMEIRRYHLTPEQAIAATLGMGTCKVDVLNTGDCAGYECSEYIMHCNGCGHEFGHVLYNEDGDVWMSEKPSFCPNCGRKVVTDG